MSRSTEGRVVDWVSSTREERQTLYRVVQAIRSSTGLSFDDIYEAAYGKAYLRSVHDESNFRKGTIGHKKVAPIHRWVIENHLALASEMAPEIFDPSLLTRWRDFLKNNARYDALTVLPLNELNLVGRSSDSPIANQTVRLGERFAFQLHTAVRGTVLAFERVRGQTYPLALHPDKRSLTCPITAGKHILPTLADGTTPDTLMEEDDPGLHGFIILVSAQEIAPQMTQGFVPGHPIADEKLDKIAEAFSGVPSHEFEVHRLNVIFTA